MCEAICRYTDICTWIVGGFHPSGLSVISPIRPRIRLFKSFPALHSGWHRNNTDASHFTSQKPIHVLRLGKGLFVTPWAFFRLPSLGPRKQVEQKSGSSPTYFVRPWRLALGAEDYLQRDLKLRASAASSLALLPWGLESSRLHSEWSSEWHHPRGILWGMWEDDFWRIRSSPKREEVYIAMVSSIFVLGTWAALFTPILS